MKIITLLFFLFISCSCLGQEQSFKSLRYDEDYRSLDHDSTLNWYDKLKFNPVSKNHSTYFSVGGEVRYQYFYFKNQNWGESPNDNDGFILNRYLGHVDLHAGKHFRTFVQLQSSLAGGEAESPSAVDQNLLDLHQAFFDFDANVGNASKITLRIGRQELSYGSQRLISVREAPNNRQSFDASKLMFRQKNVKIDGLYGHYVSAKPAIFDDRFSHDIQLWGIYGIFSSVAFFKNIDLYYLGLHKKNSAYDDGRGVETRHSLGGRVWNNATDFQYDVEGLFQFGHFAGNPISAWTLSANLSHSFLINARTTLIGLKTEAISGDKKSGDGKLNTFNPLFPKGAYFGLAALIGPYNLLDAHPYIEYYFTKELAIAADYDLFWRMNQNDGLYAVNGRLLYSGKNSSARHIGKQIGAEIRYAPNQYLNFKQEITWFQTGRYLNEAGSGKDILMFGTTVTLKF